MKNKTSTKNGITTSDELSEYYNIVKNERFGRFKIHLHLLSLNYEL